MLGAVALGPFGIAASTATAALGVSAVAAGLSKQKNNTPNPGKTSRNFQRYPKGPHTVTTSYCSSKSKGIEPDFSISSTFYRSYPNTIMTEDQNSDQMEPCNQLQPAFPESTTSIEFHDPNIEYTSDIPAIAALKNTLEQTVYLGDIAAIYYDEKIINPDISHTVDSASDKIEYPNFQRRCGDIIMAGFGPTLTVRIEQQDSVISAPSVGDIIFRLKDSPQKVTEEYVCCVLSSLSKQTLSSAISDGIENLRKIPIPVLSQDIMTEIVALWRIENKLLEQSAALRATRESLFEADDPDSYLTKLKEMNTTFQSASQGIAQAHELSFQLQHIYPYPLAYSYRSLPSGFNSLELYRNQLRVAENTLAFLALVSLSLLKPEHRHVLQKNTQENQPGSCLADFLQSGISPGHWKRLIETTRNVFAQNPTTNRLELALAGLGKSGGKRKAFGKQLQSVLEYKNDFKHDRGPQTEAELAIATREMDEWLKAVLTEVSFLTRFPIHLVRDFNKKDRRTSTVELTVESLIGDHPSWPCSSRLYHEPLMRGDLFIEVDEKTVVPLYPFIKVVECPTCKWREVFFLDKWRGPGEKACLKSFEKGHPYENENIGNDIVAWLNGEI